MRAPARILPAMIAVAASVGAGSPATASVHAYMIRTVPPASSIHNHPPRMAALAYGQAVEPRLAISR